MSEPQPTETVVASARPAWPRRWRTLATSLCALLCALTIVVCVVSIPTVFAVYSSICTQATRVGCADGQAGPQSAATLLAHGISLPMYAAYTVTLLSLVSVVYVLIALLIFLRRARDPLALFAVTFLILFSVGSNNGFLRILQEQNPAWGLLLTPLIYVGDLSIVAFFCVFPTGKFAPRWTWWVLIAFAIFQAGDLSPRLTLPSAVGGVIFLALIVALAAAQLVRYRTISTVAERVQTKWVVMGLTLTIALEIAFALPILLLNVAPGTLYDLASNSLFALAVLPIPISIYIAIVRHRLYDIDLLINRALVYGLLTASLAAVYFGLALGLQLIVSHRIVGLGIQTQQPIVIVLSTLLIAALFMPLRTRIQRLIDQRFYRHKYDSARTVARFGQTLRTEVDMQRLCDQLIDAVEETMQPAHVTLWLRSHGSAQASKR
jgi:hypothetical protein